jgi:hypothetical protein
VTPLECTSAILVVGIGITIMMHTDPGDRNIAGIFYSEKCEAHSAFSGRAGIGTPAEVPTHRENVLGSRHRT